MKDVVVRVRMTGEEKAILMEAAHGAGMTLSGFVLSRCLEGAPVASRAKRRVVLPSVSKEVSVPVRRESEGESAVVSAQAREGSKLDFSKCAHPRLQCAAEGRAICGVCREVNDEPE